MMQYYNGIKENHSLEIKSKANTILAIFLLGNVSIFIFTLGFILKTLYSFARASGGGGGEQFCCKPVSLKLLLIIVACKTLVNYVFSFQHSQIELTITANFLLFLSSLLYPLSSFPLQNECQLIHLYVGGTS